MVVPNGLKFVCLFVFEGIGKKFIKRKDKAPT
jgi:hypothetical protein